MPVWLAGGDRWAGQEWLGGPEEQGRKGRQTWKPSYEQEKEFCSHLSSYISLQRSKKSVFRRAKLWLILEKYPVCEEVIKNFFLLLLPTFLFLGRSRYNSLTFSPGKNRGIFESGVSFSSNNCCHFLNRKIFLEAQLKVFIFPDYIYVQSPTRQTRLDEVKKTVLRSKKTWVTTLNNPDLSDCQTRSRVITATNRQALPSRGAINMQIFSLSLKVCHANFISGSVR